MEVTCLPTRVGVGAAFPVCHLHRVKISTCDRALVPVTLASLHCPRLFSLYCRPDLSLFVDSSAGLACLSVSVLLSLINNSAIDPAVLCPASGSQRRARPVTNIFKGQRFMISQL